MDINYIDRYAKSLIKEAGGRIRNSLFTELTIETKSDPNDLVTNIDKETEQFFISKIREDFPEHRIFGEEGFGDTIDELSGAIWILDPIDGTMNFVHQKRNFAISLGIYVDGSGVLGYIYDVMNDHLYSAKQGEGAYFNDERLPDLKKTTVSESIIGVNATWMAPNKHVEYENMVSLLRDCRGTRSIGSAALEIAYVATGRMDAYLSMRLAPWDIAGGMVIAQETGAIASNLKGESPNLITSDGFLIANPSIHGTLIENYIRLK